MGISGSENLVKAGLRVGRDRQNMDQFHAGIGRSPPALRARSEKVKQRVIGRKAHTEEMMLMEKQVGDHV